MSTEDIKEQKSFLWVKVKTRHLTEVAEGCADSWGWRLWRPLVPPSWQKWDEPLEACSVPSRGAAMWRSTGSGGASPSKVLQS